jgi:hypothetical protein
VQVDFARAVIPASRDLDLRLFEKMRRTRHQALYAPEVTARPRDAQEVAAFAKRFVATVGARLRGSSS